MLKDMKGDSEDLCHERSQLPDLSKRDKSSNQTCCTTASFTFPLATKHRRLWARQILPTPAWMHNTVHHADCREEYHLPPDLRDEVADKFFHLRMSYKRRLQRQRPLQPPASELPASTHSTMEKGRAYCPYCDNDKHFLNNCEARRRAEDLQQNQTLRSYLEATVHQLHRAVNPETPMTADAYAAAKLEALRQVQRLPLLQRQSSNRTIHTDLNNPYST
ncbi:uncharacterized protein AKAME5_001443200 [Lates japonicus]|uniref:Uncharacterized protein n=1 Tax=Lates japonicus TaxID=270547 RepID=A0AAD3RBM6_LATJO|nr:uncharacterized protein AKAME5_001443200 [Lates japonicus]